MRLPRGRRRVTQESGVGGVHFELELEGAKLRHALGSQFSADAPRIEQFHRVR